MPSVYIDRDGAVRSAVSGSLIVPAGTTARAARMKAALMAAAADALAAAGPAPRPLTPITPAPSYARTVGDARRVLAVIDIEHLADETARDLAALTQEQPCH